MTKETLLPTSWKQKGYNSMKNFMSTNQIAQMKWTNSQKYVNYKNLFKKKQKI